MTGVNAFQSNAFQQTPGRVAFQGVFGPAPPPPPAPPPQYVQPPGYGRYNDVEHMKGWLDPWWMSDND
jgi:hypothetical protein